VKQAKSAPRDPVPWWEEQTETLTTGLTQNRRRAGKLAPLALPCTGNEDLKQKSMPDPKQEPDAESSAKRMKMKSGFVAFTGAQAATDRFLHARGQTKPNREKTPASSAANKKGEQKYSNLKTMTSYLYEKAIAREN
jgi:hypothetical protein